MIREEILTAFEDATVIEYYSSNKEIYIRVSGFIYIKQKVCCGNFIETKVYSYELDRWY